MPSTEKKCACGEFTGNGVVPVLDFHKRIWHCEDSCTPFPEWTKDKTDEYIINRGPWGWGINRMDFFDEGEPHPEDCPCGNPRSKKHGHVCFVPNKGCFVHMEGLDHLDWNRMLYLAGIKGNRQVHCLHQLIERVDRMTKQDYPALEFRVMKVAEETGELANAVGMYLRGARPGYPKPVVTPRDIVEEAVDVILTALSVARTALPGVSADDIMRVAGDKLDKWQRWIDLKDQGEKP